MLVLNGVLVEVLNFKVVSGKIVGDLLTGLVGEIVLVVNGAVNNCVGDLLDKIDSDVVVINGFGVGVFADERLLVVVRSAVNWGLAELVVERAVDCSKTDVVDG